MYMNQHPDPGSFLVDMCPSYDVWLGLTFILQFLQSGYELKASMTTRVVIPITLRHLEVLNAELVGTDPDFASQIIQVFMYATFQLMS